MSPSDAPASVEPNCATASFSSAISSALIEMPIRARSSCRTGNAGIDLLADCEAFRTLLVAVTRQIGAADEGLDIVVDKLHFQAAIE
jgi:hypothetical protein